MRNSHLGLRIVTVAGSLIGAPSTASAQPSGMMGQGIMGQSMMGHGMMMGSMARHHMYMMGDVPARYRSARNPLPYDEQTMQRGATVYGQACAACHGPTGSGNGPGGKGLSPPPANLAWGSGMHMMRGDSFLYWTIEEGGTPVGSAMPAFEGALPEKDIWAVVTYVQHGLGAPNQHHHHDCCH